MKTIFFFIINVAAWAQFIAYTDITLNPFSVSIGWQAAIGFLAVLLYIVVVAFILDREKSKK